MSTKKGSHLTAEHRRRIGEATRIALTGRRLSVEHRQHISQGGKGRVCSVETRAKNQKSS